MTDEPRGVEPVPVQLTRIEGVLNLVDHKIDNLSDRMTKVEQRVTAVELVQAQSAGASTSWRSWLPIVFAAASLAVAAAVALTR